MSLALGSGVTRKEKMTEAKDRPSDNETTTVTPLLFCLLVCCGVSDYVIISCLDTLSTLLSKTIFPGHRSVYRSSCEEL